VNVKARYANGVLTPLEPLDLDEGKEVMVSIEDTEAAVQDAPSSGNSLESIVQLFERLRNSVPPDAWDDLPTDLAKNKKHYLYGHPKE
jgi:predicted DNA-binding antitoxin AbrB/MazE fold protein